ncbi:MAG: cupredoxin family copper-binding protein [Deltaproteobacteria bacterium]|nr:cupredoxin family copper-binding protein [Deltaproteobacteria bacterium]
MTPRWMSLVAFALLGLLSVSAHAETFNVTIDKLAFAPLDLTAKVGDTVEWVNKDILAHTATATNKDWDVAIAPKQTVRLVLKKAGTVDYFCKYHPNMKGRVVVAP